MMIATPERTEPPAKVYARLLVKLHGLIAEGKGESDEADAIRDEMDRPGYALTAEEDNRLGGLSADLYALVEGGAKPVAASAPERMQWSKDLTQAHTDGNWDRILELLRRPVHESPPGMIPFMQARCWEKLGELEIALLFSLEANRQNPTDYGVSYLHLLQRLGRSSEALIQALQILEQPATEPDTIYFAAGAVLGAIRYMTDTEARPFYERILPVLKRALATERSIPKGQRSFPDLETLLICAIGMCHEHLGHLDAALAIYDDALARNPADAQVLLFRGIAQYDVNRSAALEDFGRAVRFTSRSVLPYLLLADAAIDQGDFIRCLGLCESALARTSHQHLRALLYEWIGISHVMLKHPRRIVLESFERAQELEPDNDRIRSNRALAEASADRPGADHPSWTIEDQATKSIKEEACPELFPNTLDPFLRQERMAQSALSS
jgi:tetratricopeptide (TPR) repeat protein